ncbi:HET-domain-containing protein [Aspergillus costaricaensis CBS 115574]|uniref:HET-domain-containing protein n=1 Tax=Aspergillus costaricaensis CBS 115574 TaxID=1448317 RepID=A0ACD1IG86_9EURO|nr:HET-domain-containing protein [Aspergillus costaricaensis CBS 115574]RAK89315.1 HET-domain-containing protein [Aspergillus costaricaensis CBS 115574]
MISLDIPAKNINWERVSHWLPDCDINDSADHRDSCHLEPPKYILPSFRVIDTEQQCIIIAPPFCRYATLSYVWGETKGSVQALVSNIKNLEVPGSLTRTGVSLSPVIRDAITACRHLRIRYLWVDQLCILQDEDMEKKALHLNAMGDIYGYSYVTLVDLVGTNADHGLYGVNARQRIRRWSAKVQGLYFLGRSDPFEALVAESKWMTRGWTFQETLLSSRLLLFSDTKLIYECSGRDCVVDDECGRAWPRKRVKIALGSYQDIVHDYTKRTFSFESDILRGFAGILHAGYGSDHYFGLPFGEFTKSLSWYTENGEYPRRVTETRNEVFPSWSWSSTTSSVTFFKSSQITRTVTVAIFAIPSHQDENQAFKVITDTSGFVRGRELDISYPFYISWALLLIQAWRQGCFPEKIPKKLDDSQMTWVDCERIIPDIWTFPKDISHVARGLDPQTSTVRDFHSKFPAPLQTKCEPGCIMVYTQSLRLRIVPATEGYDESNLQDQQGRIIAWLLPQTADWSSIKITPSDGRTSRFDVIALSFEADLDGLEHRNTYKSWKAYSGHGDLTWYDSSGKALPSVKKPRMLLMVLKTEKGLSKRVALAESWLRVWIHAKPEFKTFILV